jgi:membrane protease YdiL (CAAX protease family)
VTSTTPHPVAAPPAVPPGWYPDPWGAAAWRWWGGWQWTAYAGGPAPYAWPVPEPAYPHDHDASGVACWPAVVLGFLGAFLFAAVFGALVDDVSGLTLLVSLVGVWGSLIGAIVLTARRHPLPVHRLFAAPKTARAWLGAVGLGVGGGIILRVASGLVAAPFIPWVQREQRERAPIDGFHLSGKTLLLAFLVICVGAPLFEELFFRGVVLPTLARRMPVQAAMVAQAAIFASLHLSSGMGAATALYTFVAIGVGGYGLAFLRVKSRSLVPGIVAHATFNAIALLAVIFIVN